MAIEKTQTSTPTPDEIADANAGKYAQDTKTVEKVAGIGRFLLPIAGTAGVGVATAVVLDRTVPGIHAAISSTYHDTLRLLRIEKDRVPPNFDNVPSVGVIGDNNILRGVDLETIQQLPSYDEEGNPLFLLPVPPKGTVAQYTKQMSQGAAIEVNSIEQAKNLNVRNEFKLTIPKDTVVPMPKDGWIFTRYVTLNGTDGIAGVSIVYMDKKNTLQFVSINLNDIRVEDLAQATPLNPRIRHNRANVGEVHIDDAGHGDKV
jgi:hypothetical protein